MNENSLIGRTVMNLALSDDRETLTFTLADGGKVTAKTEGYCCSETWIENIEGAEALIGQAVVSVEDIAMPELGNVGTPNHPDVDVVGYYGLKITTDVGACVIDYRNDSNGYYGGYIQWFATPAEKEEGKGCDEPTERRAAPSFDGDGADRYSREALAHRIMADPNSLLFSHRKRIAEYLTAPSFDVKACAEEIAFVKRLVDLAFEHDLSNVTWRTTDGKLTPFVNVNDVFYWGCSDAESVTPENIAELERAVADVVAVSGYVHRATATDLFVARIRGERPQNCYFDGLARESGLFDLFTAAGPPRIAGIGNAEAKDETVRERLNEGLLK